LPWIFGSTTPLDGRRLAVPWLVPLASTSATPAAGAAAGSATRKASAVSSLVTMCSSQAPARDAVREEQGPCQRRGGARRPAGAFPDAGGAADLRRSEQKKVHGVRFESSRSMSPFPLDTLLASGAAESS